MKLMEIQELSPQDISEQLKKSRLELSGLRMKFASRQLEDPSQIKKKKKEIARLLTVYTQKQKTVGEHIESEISSKPKTVKKKKTETIEVKEKKEKKEKAKATVKKEARKKK